MTSFVYRRQFFLFLSPLLFVGFEEACAGNPQEDPQPQPTTAVDPLGNDEASLDGEKPKRQRRRRIGMEPVELQPKQPPVEYLSPNAEPVRRGEEPRATVSARSPNDPPADESDQGRPSSSSDNYPIILIAIVVGLFLLGALIALFKPRQPSSDESSETKS